MCQAHHRRPRREKLPWNHPLVGRRRQGQSPWARPSLGFNSPGRHGYHFLHFWDDRKAQGSRRYAQELESAYYGVAVPSGAPVCSSGRADSSAGPECDSESYFDFGPVSWFEEQGVIVCLEELN